MNPIHSQIPLSIDKHELVNGSSPINSGHCTMDTKSSSESQFSFFLIHRLQTVSHSTTSSKIRTLLERVRWHGTGSFEIFCSALGPIFPVKDGICSSNSILAHIFPNDCRYPYPHYLSASSLAFGPFSIAFAAVDLFHCSSAFCILHERLASCTFSDWHEISGSVQKIAFVMRREEKKKRYP